MAAIETIDIQIKRKGFQKKIEVVQGDTDRVIRFRVTDMTIPAGYKGRIYVRKPSGKEVYNDETNGIVSIAGNIVTVKLTSQTLAEAGVAQGQIQIIQGIQVVSSFTFLLIAEKSLASNTAIQSTNEYGVLDNLIEDAQNTLAQCQTQLTNMKNQASLIGDGNIGTSTSSTHTLPTSEGAAVLRELPGVTEQVGTTGAQLLDLSKCYFDGVTVVDSIKNTVQCNIQGGYFGVIHYSGINNIIAANKGKYLTLSHKMKKIPNRVTSIAIFGNYSDGAKSKEVSSDGNVSMQIPDTLQSISYIEIRLNRSSTIITDTTTTISEIMLNIGETALPFESYTGGKPGPNPDYPQRIQGVGDSKDGKYIVQVKSRGANLFDLKDTPKRIYTNPVEISGEKITVTTTETQTSIPGVFYRIGKYTDYVGKTLYLKCDSMAMAGNYGARVNLRSTSDNSSSKRSLLNYLHTKSGQWMSVKIPEQSDPDEDTLTLALYVYGDAEGSLPNAGSKATFGSIILSEVQTEEYHPYRESMAYIELDQPLYAGDKIYLEDGHLWEYRENAVVEYDGSADEKWGIDQNNTRPYISIGITGIPEMVYCNAFTYTKVTSPPAGYFRHNNNLLFYWTGKETTVAEWRSWLASHPITVVYKLATPTKTRLNQPAAYGLRTYGDQTHIYIPDALEPEFSVDYPLNTAGGYALDGFCQSRINEAQEEINRQALDDRISKIEVDLGANTFIVE